MAEKQTPSDEASTAESSTTTTTTSALSATDLRQQGNHQFHQKEYHNAVALYTQALHQNETTHDTTTTTIDAASSATPATEMGEGGVDLRLQERVLNLCNRSAAFLVLNELEEAAHDALAAVELSRPVTDHNDDQEETSTTTTSASGGASSPLASLGSLSLYAKSVYRYAKVLIAQRESDKVALVLQEALRLFETFTRAAAKLKVSQASEEHRHVQKQIQSLIDLKVSLQNKQLEQPQSSAAQVLLSSSGPETSIKEVFRPVSIKEFKIDRTESDKPESQNPANLLGWGNFSEIWRVHHKETQEVFALKQISKKQAADLAKRQHPNVYNEIHMERRVLLERLPPHKHLIRMYHAFSDYTHLYYLMELHEKWSDLWSEMKWIFPIANNTSTKSLLVGCHRAQARLWVYQLVLALEHMHAHGIVHRDLKPENVLLDRHGHVIVIDLGTAKDQIHRDLNGPEFVGTPDFMSPEQVNDDRFGAATPRADLWTLGAVAYILQTGVTPFWTASPYLAFLRIQRGLVSRSWGITDDDAWDFIQKLMQTNPDQRLGANDSAATHWKQLLQTENAGGSVEKGEETKGSAIGYPSLRQHPYLADIDATYSEIQSKGLPRPKTPIPSLRDLCYRSIVTWIQQQDDLDVAEEEEEAVQAKRQKEDEKLASLPSLDRNAVLHLMDRRQILGKQPHLYERFWRTTATPALWRHKVRPETRDVVGLTHMNDGQGQAPEHLINPDSDPRHNPRKNLQKGSVENPTLDFVLLCSPLLSRFSLWANEENAGKRQLHLKAFRKAISRVNKTRPKLVLVVVASSLSSYLSPDQPPLKWLGRISDSIHVVVHHEDNAYASFWWSGIQGMCIASPEATPNAGENVDEDEVKHVQSLHMNWVREQMELSRLSKHPLFCFSRDNLEDLPLLWLKRLARGRTLALFVPAVGRKDDDGRKTNSKGDRIAIEYKANEEVSPVALYSDAGAATEDTDDCVSVKSTDSNEDAGDESTMTVHTLSFSNGDKTALTWIRVDPVNHDTWKVDREDVE